MGSAHALSVDTHTAAAVVLLLLQAVQQGRGVPLSLILVCPPPLPLCTLPFTDAASNSHLQLQEHFEMLAEKGLASSQLVPRHT